MNVSSKPVLPFFILLCADGYQFSQHLFSSAPFSTILKGLWGQFAKTTLLKASIPSWMWQSMVDSRCLEWSHHKANKQLKNATEGRLGQFLLHLTIGA